MYARGSGEAARRAKRGRQPEKKRPFSLALGVVSLFSCLSRLAPSVTCVAICVSRVLLDGLQKKERLLVVYARTRRLDAHERERRAKEAIWGTWA